MDKTTKFLLALVTAGLWANVAALTLQPAVAEEQAIKQESMVEKYVKGMYFGQCPNQKICN
jgi:hypothetical protein